MLPAARCLPLLQAKHPGVTVASFDTTEDAIEGLAAYLGVTGLPQFRFYKVRGCGGSSCTLMRSCAVGVVSCLLAFVAWPAEPPP